MGGREIAAPLGGICQLRARAHKRADVCWAGQSAGPGEEARSAQVGQGQEAEAAAQKSPLQTHSAPNLENPEYIVISNFRGFGVKNGRFFLS
jgi:hypothetical protein